MILSIEVFYCFKVNQRVDCFLVVSRVHLLFVFEEFSTPLVEAIRSNEIDRHCSKIYNQEFIVIKKKNCSCHKDQLYKDW